MRRWFARLSVTFLFALTGAALACDLPEDAYTIDLSDFGLIRVGDLTTDGDIFTLANGVCVEGVSGWTLETDDAVVNMTAGAFEIDAADVRLRLDDLMLAASSLVASDTELVLTELTFASSSLQGRADAGRYNLLTTLTTLDNPAATGENFSLAGSSAQIEAGRVTFKDAVATTCVCADAPLYIVNAEEAVYELDSSSIRLSAASLDLAGFSFAFESVSISEETFSNFTFPLVIEYVSDSEDAKGTGLGVRVPNVPAGEGLALELGVQGLDTDKPLSGVLVARYRDISGDTSTRFDVGIARFDADTGTLGSQADFAVTQQLTPALAATFGINNRHWREQDYLHEGYLSLDASALLFSAAEANVRGAASLTAAASSQGLGANTVAGARLGASSSLTLRSSVTPAGAFSLVARGDASYYPNDARRQLALTLSPRWTASFGALQTDAAYTRRFSNAGSPFSTKLDRLEPINRVSVVLVAGGELNQLKLTGGYDFLPDGGVNTLGMAGKLLLTESATFSVRPFVNADLARLLNPNLSTDRRAFFELGSDALGARWEVGLALRSAFDPFEFTKLETRFSFPLDAGGAQLQPFVALDVLPSLTSAELPRVSGHGLEITVPTCCGTLIAGYRQVDNRFTTSLAVELGTALAAQAGQ